MKIGTGYSNDNDAFFSGKKVAEKAIAKGALKRSDLVIAFCSGQLDHNDFFKGLQSVIGKQTPIVGGSAPGIITNDYLSYEGYPAGAAVFQSDTLKPRVAAAGDLDKDEKSAGILLSHNFSDILSKDLLLIFYDSVKNAATDSTPCILNASSHLIKGIEQTLNSKVPVIGAGLIGDYTFGPAKQFCGSCVDSKSVIGVALTGNFKFYYKIMHGCTPLDGIYHTITKIKDSFIYELDGKPIVKLIDDLYGNQDWQSQNPVKLLTIGINHGSRYLEPAEDNYVNRLITGVLPDGEGIAIFEPDLQIGAEIQFMLRDNAKMIESAKKNSSDLMDQIKTDQRQALFGFYIDCAGRTANFSNTLIEEASEVQKVFNRYNTTLFGFYSGVEIAPFMKKSKGLDWTGVLTVVAR